MSEANTVKTKKEQPTVDSDVDEQNTNEHDEGGRPPNSIAGVFRKFFGKPKRGRTSAATRDLKQDRTRALVVLIGGTVGSVLLFVAVLSTPPTRLGQRERERALPNLGRRGPSGPTRLASATPMLNAQVQSDESTQDRISATDIHNTSQRDTPEADSSQNAGVNALLERRDTSSSSGDQSPVYRRNDTNAERTYGFSAGNTNAGTTKTEAGSVYPTFGYNSSSPQTAPTLIRAATPPSSIIFVRSISAAGQSNPISAVQLHSEQPTLLPSGSRLIARLESAVTNALKAPVVATIEYNYERDGVILIPAGTKAIGELQASTSGYVGITFHTLQMPDGRNEQIDALAMDLRNEPIKGKVTGTNRGRKLLTRTLSGVGTIAAYVVGPSGSGLGQTITGGTLLRERLASNIASAGEQELTNAALSQNIVVTVPAQTRLYIVFRKGVEQAPIPSASSAVGNNRPEIPTVQELRELMDLRREINQMYAESSARATSSKP